MSAPELTAITTTEDESKTAYTAAYVPDETVDLVVAVVDAGLKSNGAGMVKACYDAVQHQHIGPLIHVGCSIGLEKSVVGLGKLIGLGLETFVGLLGFLLMMQTADAPMPPPRRTAPPELVARFKAQAKVSLAEPCYRQIYAGRD